MATALVALTPEQVARLHDPVGVALSDLAIALMLDAIVALAIDSTAAQSESDGPSAHRYILSVAAQHAAAYVQRRTADYIAGDPLSWVTAAPTPIGGSGEPLHLACDAAATQAHARLVETVAAVKGGAS